MGLSPMMQQYLQMKEEHKDCILLWRLGDFYEMFFEDAETVSRELELTLTGRDCGLEERAPMCGIPHHAVNGYVERLLDKGHKVAICEQLEDPALAKGLVKRDIVRIITPGTVTDPAMLDERSNSFLMAVCFNGEKAGLALADVTTGECIAEEVTADILPDEYACLQPREVITNDLVRLRGALGREDHTFSELPANRFSHKDGDESLREHFRVASLSGLGLDEEHRNAVCALGALLSYLTETQKISLSHITGVRIRRPGETMFLDRGTRRNLELTESLRGRGKRGSLLWLLDKTSTAMGGRQLRAWIEQPLLKPAAIRRRLEAVKELTGQTVLSMTLSEKLQGVYDVERLLTKASYQTLNARDCLALMASFRQIPGIRDLLHSLSAPLIREAMRGLDPLEDITTLLERAIHPDAPAVITEGGIIRDGYSAMLDEYREASRNGRQWVAELENRERDRTGIRNLRIQFNRVFGYCIEVTKSFYDLVPEDYVRRQTLANCERYTTQELREMEQKIVGAQEQATRLELQLFGEIREAIAAEIPRIQRTAAALKTLDCLLSLARVAVQNRYVCPEIVTDGSLEIRDGRHPVVEQYLSDGSFVPNDTEMNTSDSRMLIITGPNMAGKSTYMRQVALMVLMAHIGSFVPASSAKIPAVDRIFTRIGASDDLSGGQSTFMVEMSETAAILRSATAKSLIVLDEIGRGTSTFDGLAIAWAVVEYLCDKKSCGAKTLFATHYHELSELEGHLPGVRNYCSAVKEHGEDVIFLRRIVPGGADRSFGIQVARLAGLPHSVIMRAHEIQARIEVSDINQNTIGQNILGEKKKTRSEQVNMFEMDRLKLIEELQALDVMALTPMEAINQLFLLREKAKKL